MELEKLDNIYRLYNFEIFPFENDCVRVYTYRRSYFSNADVIILDTNIAPEDLVEVSKQIESLGFSVKLRNYRTLDEAENSLFDGFFDIKSSNSVLRKSYYDYKKRAEQVLFGEYRYIKSEYLDVEKNILRTDSVVDTILNDLHLGGPVLIMLEAPAGFGKTSTSYEIVKNLSEVDGTSKIPLFTELSRNRQAPIFKYVLYDEIDRNFRGLNLELVNKHIIEGRIPVIIDGFDELLKMKISDRTEERFEDAEPMLETIKELLKGQSKILLTTRRTAVFSEDDFFQWLDNNSQQFTFRRYSILTPTITDWISASREKELSNAGLNLKSISNPLLLAYLKSMNEYDFMSYINDMDSIIDGYIKRLLEREQERQELFMSVEEQKYILKNIAKHFTDQDITSESKDIIEKQILDKETPLLFKVLDRYPSTQRPTLEQLKSKLVIHAFLDRKSDSGQQIGFVNDFILGSFVGENIISEQDQWIGMERFIDFVLSAYIPRNSKTKTKIYDILHKNVLDYVSFPKRVYIDNYLYGCINRDVKSEYLSGLEFRDRFINKRYTLQSVIFSDCDFHQIQFDLNLTSNCNFINCNFYNCLFPDEFNPFKELSLTNCTFEPAMESKLLDSYDSYNSVLTVCSPVDLYERKVLEKFWPTGKERFTPHKRPGTLRLGIPTEDIENIDEAIDSLIKKKILIQRRGHHSLELNIEFIKEIKEILGR